MIIRDADENDLNSLCEIAENELKVSFDRTKTEEKFKKVLREENRLFVCEDKKIVVGFIHLEEYDFLFMPRVKNVLGLAVKREYQHKGIGRMLLQRGEQFAKECGCDGVRLNSGIERHNAHEFYKAMGYKAEKEQIRFCKYFKGDE